MKNPHYSKALKEEVKKKALEGTPVNQLAKEYGIHFTTIYDWLKNNKIRVTYNANPPKPAAPKQVKATAPTVSQEAHDAEIAFMMTEKLNLEKTVEEQKALIAEQQEQLNNYKRYSERMKDAIVIMAIERTLNR